VAYEIADGARLRELRHGGKILHPPPDPRVGICAACPRLAHCQAVAKAGCCGSYEPIHILTDCPEGLFPQGGLDGDFDLDRSD